MSGDRPPAAARRRLPAALPLIVLLAGAGCGGGGSPGLAPPRVAPARVFSLAAFTPGGVVPAGRPATVSFSIRMPSGAALTRYRTGSGPHTGVHLILVRTDLAYIIHQHPPEQPDGSFRARVSFPAPGSYRVLVDAYPNLPGGQPNFQLVRTIEVGGRTPLRPLPPFRPVVTVHGYRFAVQALPPLHAIQAAFVHVSVTDPRGRPLVLTPWFGALAHAIFFRAGSLDYFHTHVCGAGAANCTSVLGAGRVSGTSTAPGRLTLGVLLPAPGTWRLFLQLRDRGRVLTAPYTLHVAP